MSLTNAYADLSEVKGALRIPTSDTIDDPQLTIAINAASRQIDGETDRVFYLESGTRVYTPESSVLVRTDDISSLTKLETGTNGTFDVEIPATDFQLEPLNGVSGGITEPATRIRATGAFLFPVFSHRLTNLNQATVRVTGDFGFAEIPDAIKQATIVLAMRLFKRLDSPLAVAGFGDLGAIRVGRVDPDVMALIQPFVRGGRGVA